MRSEHKRILIQILLFVTTFFTTTLAGAWWCNSKLWISLYPLFYNPEFTVQDFVQGMQFSIPFLLILTVHEFGHYFTAVYHKVKSSLPYYIPFPPILFSIGTMGALIRLRSKVPSTIKNFDIGIAGPLAGFIVAVGVLYYGFATLPPPEHIFTIHPEYEQYGLNYAEHVYAQPDSVSGLSLTLGKNLLFIFFENVVAEPSRVPNVHEMMHYPWLFAGFLALVFTSLNLLPIGQLDGGHVLYGLVGFRKHRIIASVIFVLFILYAGFGLEFLLSAEPSKLLFPEAPVFITIPGYVLFLYFCFTGLQLPVRDTIMYTIAVFAVQYLASYVLPEIKGYPGWLLFGILLGRVLGIPHPPSEIEQPLDEKRKILGWVALVIFVISFTPSPIN